MVLRAPREFADGTSTVGKLCVSSFRSARSFFAFAALSLLFFGETSRVGWRRGSERDPPDPDPILGHGRIVAGTDIQNEESIQNVFSIVCNTTGDLKIRILPSGFRLAGLAGFWDR